jgi:hypothetical protein
MNKLLKKVVKKLPRKIRAQVIRHSLPEFERKVSNVRFRQALTLEDYYRCFNLLYTAYLREGFTEEDSTNIRTVLHHCSPNTRIFLAETEDTNTIICTASVFVDGPLGLPIDNGFKEDVDTLRSNGSKIVEIGCLASNISYSKGNQNIPMHMNKIMHVYIEEVLKADYVVITTNPRHSFVYEDILLFDKIGDLEFFNYVNSAPAVAYCQPMMNWFSRLKKVYGNFPYEKNLYEFFYEDKYTIPEIKTIDGINYGKELIDTIVDKYT